MHILSKINLQKYNVYPSFRQGQEKAITQMLKSWELGSKIIDLNAPTAAGKTLNLYVFGKVLEKEYFVSNILFTSPQVSLIQEGNLFDLSKIVGKHNYECLGISGYTAEDCPFGSREPGFVRCTECPYRIAKAAFKKANFRATTFARYQVDPSLYLETKILEVDESTNLPNALLDSATIKLNIAIKKTSLAERKELLRKELSKLDIKDYLNEYSQVLQKKLKEVTINCKDVRKDIINTTRKLTARETKMLSKVRKEYNYYRNNLDSCNQALRYLSLEVPYVLTTDTEEVFNVSTRRKELTISPYFKLLDCKVPFADLVAKLDCIVLASGTPTTELLTNKATSVKVVHPIPVDRRTIYYDPVGSMTKDGRFRFAKPMAEKISQLHDIFSAKTIVHCGNYQIANLINEHLCGLQPNVLLQFSGERNEVLRHWKRLDNAIFLSVAFEQGLDLEGPEYPMNIIAKVPFPNLGDDWIQARNKYDNYAWYSKTVAIQIQQACGRTTRTPKDNSMTYILDGSFGSFLTRNKSLFQDWFLEALVIC